MSPIFHKEDGYTFKVFSNEEDRRHIHIIKAENEAKFWLEPTIELAENYGFSSKEIKRITLIVEQYGNEFRQKYTEHFGKRIDD